MENLINLYATTFITDYLSSVSQKKLFELDISYVALFLLQVLNILGTTVYAFFKISVFEFILIKIAINFILCLLITKSYKIKDITLLFFSYLIFSFSIYGFSVFLTTYARFLIYELFGVKIVKFHNYLLEIGILGFVLVIVFFSKSMGDSKKIKAFLKKVSFSLFGKHIEITGLLDSGNMLYDPKTKKPIIVISVEVLKKVLPPKGYQKFVCGDYSSVKIHSMISYESVGSKSFKMPVFEVSNMGVFSNGRWQKKDCLIGVVNQKFSGGKYECLIHRDLI